MTKSFSAEMFKRFSGQGWIVQDENQPGPKGMVAIAGWGDKTGGYSVWCEAGAAVEGSKRVKAIMGEKVWL